MIELDNISTLPPKGSAKADSKKQIRPLRKELFQLQNKFYADGRFALLVILQGVDTARKDGISKNLNIIYHE